MITVGVVSFFAKTFWQFVIVRFFIGIAAAGMVGAKNVFGECKMVSQLQH